MPFSVFIMYLIPLLFKNIIIKNLKIWQVITAFHLSCKGSPFLPMSYYWAKLFFDLLIAKFIEKFLQPRLSSRSYIALIK